MLQKLTSRKFWICIAAFLSSIATSVVGIHSDNEVITIAGAVCSILSAAIYAACESYVDGVNKE